MTAIIVPYFFYQIITISIHVHIVTFNLYLILLKYRFRAELETFSVIAFFTAYTTG